MIDSRKKKMNNKLFDNPTLQDKVTDWLLDFVSKKSNPFLFLDLLEVSIQEVRMLLTTKKYDDIINLSEE